MSMDTPLEYAPKLHPHWLEPSLQTALKCMGTIRLAADKLPNFGGVGVDIAVKDGIVKCDDPKSSVDQVKFCAKICSLPFTPPNKVKELVDPCLTSIISQRNQFKHFCRKLELQRNSLVASHTLKHQTDLLNLQNKLQKMNLNSDYTDTFIPQSILELAKDFPKSDLPLISNANLNYVGGCLTSSELDSKQLLLHPTGKKLNNIGITTLTETSQPFKTFHASDYRKHCVKLKGGIIQQVVSACSGTCFVRQQNHCHFLNFENASNIVHSEVIQNVGLSHINASPYSPGDVVVTYEDKKIDVINVEDSEVLWSINKQGYLDKFEMSDYTVCEFGSHPMSLLCLNQKQMYSFDLRMKDSIRTLFSCGKSYVDERLVLTKNTKANAFQHLVSSTYHLYICDERYPKRPVLFWNHMTEGTPMYCDITRYASNEDSSNMVAILGHQETSDVAAFFLDSHHSFVQPLSPNSPIFLSSLPDFGHSLRFHCLNVSDKVVKRLSFPLAGVSVVPHNSNTGFTVFQINSLGDLFYQDFSDACVGDENRERTYRVDSGCVLPPAEKILPFVSDWMKEVGRCKVAESCDELIRIDMDLSDIWSDSNEGSSNCILCASTEMCQDIITIGKCPSCGLDSLYSKQLYEAFHSGSATLGEVEKSGPSRFNIINLERFDDSYSKKILEPWKTGENVSSTSPEWNFDTEFDLDSTLINVSQLSSSNLDISTSKKPKDLQPSNQNISQQFSKVQNISQDISKPEIILNDFSNLQTFPNTSDDFFPSQESFFDAIPPSQEYRPLVGETLRTPKLKRNVGRTNMSAAGF